MEKCKCLTEEWFPIMNLEYSGIETIIFPRLKILRVRSYYNEGPNGLFDTQDIANTEYCPFCGRKFE